MVKMYLHSNANFNSSTNTNNANSNEFFELIIKNININYDNNSIDDDYAKALGLAIRSVNISPMTSNTWYLLILIPIIIMIIPILILIGLRSVKFLKLGT
jgi:hypothetical protein